MPRKKTTKVMLDFSNQQKSAAIPSNMQRLAKRCCRIVLEEENIDSDAEVSLTILDNDEIKRLNFQYRNNNAITDVLSFPLSDGEEFDINPETGCIMLGDIIISAERAKEQAEEYGHSLERELCFLIIHSMLHLLGYDHEKGEEDEKIMFDKQKKILEKLGISRQ